MCQITFLQLKFLLAIQEFRTPFLDWLFVTITKLNDYGIVMILGLIIYYMYSKNKIVFLWSATLIINQIVVELIFKPIMAIPRPFTYVDTIELLVKTPSTFSFPSGHTASMFCLAILIFHFNKKWGSGLIIFATLMGFSRMYLFVHFPLDVLTGALVGWIVADTAIMLNKRFKWVQVNG